MPRKKNIEAGTHEKYIPKGRLEDLKQLAQDFEFIVNKDLALSKYIEFISSLIDRSIDGDSKQAPVNFDTQRIMLGMDKGFKPFIDSLIDAKFIEQDRSNFKIGEKSYEYKPIYDEIEIISIEKKTLTKKTNKMLQGGESPVDNKLEFYKEVLKKITIDNSIYNEINEIIKTIKEKKYNKQNKINKSNKGINPFNYSFVPYNEILKKAVDTHYSYVPCTTIGDCPSATPYSFVPFTSVAKLPVELYGVYKIMIGQFKVNRPLIHSRVYSNITNLSRAYRHLLRLNGLPFIGFDVANCQPLFATIPFKEYSINNYGCIKEDVVEYQKACESGLFYEYFMELNGVKTNDEDARTEFKIKFFALVFYSMNYAKFPAMLQQFIDKYPTCYEAIYRIKGDKWFSDRYTDFPEYMTYLETKVMWEANVELINKGYDVVNIFDSLYSDSEETIEEAKKIVIEKFAHYEICPKLKDIDYRNKVTSPIATKIIDPIIQSREVIKVSNDSENNTDVSLIVGANDKFVEKYISELNLSVYSKEYFVEQYKLNEDEAIEMYEGQLEKIERLKKTT